MNTTADMGSETDSRPDEQLLDVGPNPILKVEGEGRLTIVGDDRDSVSIEASGELDVDRHETTLTVKFKGDVEMHVPQGAQIEAGKIERHLRISNVHGGIRVDATGQSLELENVGPSSIRAVGARFIARDVNGDLGVEAVGGSAKVANVIGQAKLKQVGGSIVAEDVEGDIVSAAGGSARLSFTPRQGGQYAVTAGGSIRCAIPADSNADVRLAAGSQKVKVGLPAARVAKGAGSRVFTIGSGGASIVLTAGGSVWLGESLDSDDVDAWSAQFDADFEHKMEALGERMAVLGETLGRDFGFLGEDIADRVTQAVEKVQSKAVRRLERRMAKQRRREGRQRNTRDFISVPNRPARPVRPTPPAPPPPEPISDEERRAVLRMVSEGKISPEQADELLSAMGA